MFKLWLVVKREFITRVMTKGFVISTIAIPALIGGLIFFQFLVTRSQASKTTKLAVLDEAGGLGQSVAESLAKTRLPGGMPQFEVTKVYELTPGSAEVRAALTSSVRQKRLDGYLVIPANALNGGQPSYYCRSAGALTIINSVNRAIDDAELIAVLRQSGIKTGDLQRFFPSVESRLIRLTRQGESEETGQTFGLAIAVATILYASLLMYGVTTMRSVLEEKSTRVMEILVSSVRPFQLLAGKVLGVGAVGITQLLVWLVSASLLAGQGMIMARIFGPGTAGLSIHIPPALIVYAVLFFLGGYFMFASLYAAIGAMVSNEQDSQQMQMPVTLLIVASFSLFGVILGHPNSTASIILSMIPFFSPILMTMRISLQMPPVWQIAASLTILFVTAVGIIYFSARIYRVGVLMYGKRPSLVELIRWLRYN
jgi:ABC-2 type transport system permease protein